ncbi:FHA domain-containing protein [Dactylosporangium sp. NPDC051485]|uniref:FHA domain-containing protein n=1 Tax=Dactylosporangium sp. NPDC051485 TaxID=3154846 RepID=UPI003441FD93
MGTLVVDVHDTTYTLKDGDELTFGRDSRCTVRLDAADAGISRMAGRIRSEAGTWFVTNLSGKRPLHIADANGFAVPLPVAQAGWPLSRRAVDQPRLTVLVPGETWTYALNLRISDPLPVESTPPPTGQDPVSTRVPTLRLTDNRREVLVALTRGYLRPYPHYDPRPCGYDEIAGLLGLTRTQVTRRIEDVRDTLIAAGVEGLEGVRDTRRPLCEWLLAMRVVTPTDLDWLTRRIDATRARDQEPATPEAAAQPDKGPGTTLFAQRTQTRVAHAAHRAARAVASLLQAQLAHEHGTDWLTSVNAARQARGLPAGRSLDDDRFCLALLARDHATRGWADDDVRAAAAALKALADQAAHGRPTTAADVTAAQHHADRIQRWARTASSPQLNP